MAEASIKGTIFAPVVEDIQALREAGRVSEDLLAAELEARDLELLEEKVQLAQWYPMSTYSRCVDLLCRVAGGGKSAYYEERGRSSARRLMDAGLYSQLDLLDSIVDNRDYNDPETRSEVMRSYRKRLNVIVSMAGSIYNVGQWKVVEDPEHPGRAQIEIHDARAYSDGMAGAIVGFFDECAHRVHAKIEKLFRYERPTPALIRIRMVEDLADARQRMIE